MYHFVVVRHRPVLCTMVHKTMYIINYHLDGAQCDVIGVDDVNLF